MPKGGQTTKGGMSLGVTRASPDLYRSTRELCEPRLKPTSIYRLLAEQGHKEGRCVRLHPKHPVLDRARKRQRDPGWRARYRATRPKVERKIAHLMRRKHGGRC